VPDLIGMRRGAPSVHMRIGIATGDVTFGNVGSDSMKGFTAIGDSVNLAARLESANKLYGTSILVAEPTWTDAGAAVEGRPLDLIRVVGKEEPVRIFELTGLAGQGSAADAEFREAFTLALSRFHAGAIAQAGAAFEACRAMRATDRPTQIFLERIATIGKIGLPDAWDGVWTMASK
jgi:adenylate cyclase